MEYPKKFLEGKRGVAKSSKGGYMAYIKDSVRHGFDSKEIARSYSKNKSKALAKAKGVITKSEAKGIKKSINSALKD